MSSQINLKNVYTPSQLVAQDVTQLLGHMRSPFLEYCGTGNVSFGDSGGYMSGKTVSFLVAGSPQVNKGERVRFTPWSQRAISITANEERWQRSITPQVNITDSSFFYNRKQRLNMLSSTFVMAFKRQLELDASRYAAEHSPIIPNYNLALNQEIEFPTGPNGKSKFDQTTINWLQKLRYDLRFPENSYRLVLNTLDHMDLSNSLVNIYNEKINALALQAGQPPSKISGLPIVASPDLNIHRLAKEGQPLGGLYFVSTPVSDDNPIAIIRNTNAASGDGSENDPNAIWLRASDIIYYKAKSAGEPGLHWVDGSTKRAIPDSRYSFCITSDLFLKNYFASNSGWGDLEYEDIIYKIPPGEQLSVSVSHRPIATPFFQNVSREIRTFQGSDAEPSGDEWFILPDHYKNLAINPNYLLCHSFKINPMDDTEHSYAEDKKNNLTILISKLRNFQESQRRANIIDATSLNAFGSIPQNLFTLPTGVNR